MKYSEAKKVLEQQEKAKAVLDAYKKVESAHEQFGFKTRRELIKALQEIDQAGKGGGRRKGQARGKRGLSPEVIDQIKTLKTEGKSNAEIARTTGVSALTVAKYVKAAAGPKAGPRKAAKPRAKSQAKPKKKAGRGKRGLPPETVDQIKTMKGEGKTNAEISRTAGVSPLTVAKYVKGQPGVKKAAKPRAKKTKAKA